MMRMTDKSFTLVEIMIVVAIIILLAALTIPNLFRARLNANEAAAIASLRTISTALENFRAAQTPATYPTTNPGLVALSGATPPYIDSVLGSGTKQGYSFNYAFVDANQYTCLASPTTPGLTGIRYFFVDQSGVIRSSTTAAGAPTGAPIE